METILYFKIRTRGLLDSQITIQNHTNSDLFNQKLSQTNSNGHIFTSLPIKKIMVGPTVSMF